jgi:glutamate-1-semialdehyde aminotransferase
VIQLGVFSFPLATKQWSISAAHTVADVNATLEAVDEALAHVQAGELAAS